MIDLDSFVSQLSENGMRLVVGAPYHFGPGNCDGGYYRVHLRFKDEEMHETF